MKLISLGFIPFFLLGINQISSPNSQDWILLFDGKTLFGWKNLAPDCQVKNGAIHFPFRTKTQLTHSTEFSNLRGEVVYHIEGDGEGEIVFTPVIGSKESRENTLTLPHTKNRSTFKFDIKGGKLISAGNGANSKGVWGHISINGKGLVVQGVKIQPELTEEIFNGKDFSGWKIFPEKKSKFIIEENTFRVIDGPGDLQTVKTFGNFVLQFEVKSNGKHLNSGLFFRCIPGEYQKGYEVQIRNQWEGDDKSKPVDFGTGAIYRRQPARMVNAEDGKWATITLVAHKNHIATWVNGLQVTDWYDQRPESNNAREGYRKSPGCLSIQGHDPTTDLSFRNFRVWNGDK